MGVINKNAVQKFSRGRLFYLSGYFRFPHNKVHKNSLPNQSMLSLMIILNIAIYFLFS